MLFSLEGSTTGPRQGAGVAVSPAVSGLRSGGAYLENCIAAVGVLYMVKI